MKITHFSPLHEVNRFFDDVLDALPKRFGDLAVDLYQEGENLIAEMAVAGIDITTTDVNVVDDVLKISGHREEKKEHQDKDFFSREIHRGSFERSLRLPSPVIAEETKASYKDGLLKVVMPLRKGSVKKKIEINQE